VRVQCPVGHDSPMGVRERIAGTLESGVMKAPPWRASIPAAPPDHKRVSTTVPVGQRLAAEGLPSGCQQFGGALRRLGAVAHAELAVERAGVFLDRLGADVHRRRDLSVGGPGADQRQHLTLAI
jgi:hypothetical protein